MSDNPLDALAMRERAAVVADKMSSSAKLRISGKSPADTEKSWGMFGCAEAVAASIRALPTTFTDAELLAAAMRLPEVRELVESLKMASIWLNYDGRYDMQGINAALAPFMKGGE